MKSDQEATIASLKTSLDWAKGIMIALFSAFVVGAVALWGQINTLNKSLGNIEGRLAGIETVLASVDRRLQALEGRFEAFDARLIVIEMSVQRRGAPLSPGSFEDVVPPAPEYSAAYNFSVFSVYLEPKTGEPLYIANRSKNLLIWPAFGEVSKNWVLWDSEAWTAFPDLPEGTKAAVAKLLWTD